MTEWKYIDDYKALIYLLDALGSLARISLTGTTLPALTASVCEYAVNTNKIEQAKKLCSYQHLLWCVNEYCKKADNNPEAQKMAKECDFWECWLIIDDVRYWLTEIKHITLEEAPEYAP